MAGIRYNQIMNLSVVFEVYGDCRVGSRTSSVISGQLFVYYP